MTDLSKEKIILYTIQGVVNDLSKEDRDKVNAAKEELDIFLKSFFKFHGDAASLAFTLATIETTIKEEEG